MGNLGRDFTSLLSKEASLLSPWALARPSLLLLRMAPKLVQKAGSSGNREDRTPDHRPCSSGQG